MEVRFNTYKQRSVAKFLIIYCVSMTVESVNYSAQMFASFRISLDTSLRGINYFCIICLFPNIGNTGNQPPPREKKSIIQEGFGFLYFTILISVSLKPVHNAKMVNTSLTEILVMF